MSIRYVLLTDCNHAIGEIFCCCTWEGSSEVIWTVIDFIMELNSRSVLTLRILHLNAHDTSKNSFHIGVEIEAIHHLN